MHVYVCICMYMYMYICVYAYEYTLNLCMFIYICIDEAYKVVGSHLEFSNILSVSYFSSTLPPHYPLISLHLNLSPHFVLSIVSDIHCRFLCSTFCGEDDSCIQNTVTSIGLLYLHKVRRGLRDLIA